MFSKTKIALSAAIVLSTAFAASAATKPTQIGGTAFFTMIPGYDQSGGRVAITDPDHAGQPQLAGDQTPRKD
jgi:hypothetical protein